MVLVEANVLGLSFRERPIGRLFIAFKPYKIEELQIY